jgi:regulation of enolase protein 1 (concanavalin A-like superfamily)
MRPNGALLRAIAETLETRRFLAAQIVGNPTSFATIQAAVDAASPGATITVDAGTYPEQVAISKTLTINGARAGVDGRSNARGVNESIVTGADIGGGVRSSAFRIAANNVVIDGFTVQGETNPSDTSGAGIVITPNRAGTKIVNNVVQNNVAGVFLSNNSATNPAIIQRNLFLNNNNDGLVSGRGVYSDGGISGGTLTNVLIDSNAFIRNFGGPSTTTVEAAVAFQAGPASSQTNIAVTNNVFDGNGKAMLFFNASGVTISGNVITYCRDSPSAALRFEGGMSNVTIQGNNLYGNGPRAIRIDNQASSGTNSNFAITDNNFYRNGTDGRGLNAGLYVDAGTFSGTLNAANNWWGSASGPSGDGAGTGDAVLANGNNVAWTAFATDPVLERQSPYYGEPQQITSFIQVEDYDHGGSGIAYQDKEASNLGGKFRPYQGVDIVASTDVDSATGFTVGYTRPAEYIEYTVNIPQTGTYTFDMRVANAQTTGGVIHLEVDGVDVSGPINVVTTNSLSIWKTMTRTGLNLPAGIHVLRIAMDTGGSAGSFGNWNWFKFTPTSVAPVPSAPSGLAAAAAGMTQINLTWTDTATDETGFKIERSLNGVDGWSSAGTASAEATSFSDTTGLSAGTKYYYRVRATNAVGDSDNSNIASATTQSPEVTYVSALNPISAVNGWGPYERDRSNGSTGAADGKTITLNSVTYAKGLGVHAASQLVYNLVGAYGRFMSDVGVDDETGAGTVVFQVFADNVKIYDSGTMTQNSATKSIDVSVAGVQQLMLIVTNAGDDNSFDHADWANSRLTTAPAPVVPAAPSLLVATAAGTNQINLTWADNANNETGFKIERSTDGVTFTQIGTAAANATAYSDSTGLNAATKYYYQVRANNSVGDSGYSNIANATTTAAPTAPAAPSGLTATAVSSAQINLSWTDNANNETGFVVERSLNGVDGWTTAGTPAANAVSFSDSSGLSASTKYFYRVRATNGVGPSGDSNITDATTLAASSLPAPWVQTDIGPVGVTGNASFSNGVYTLQAGGADIWSTADSFGFVYQSFSGDGQILAKVQSLQNTAPYAEAGVMIRETLAPNSRHATLVVTAQKGVGFVRRTASGGTSSVTTNSGITAPYWVKLIRVGNTITSYRSSNGTTWTLSGSATVAMTANVYIGLVVASHDTAVLNTATFSNVTISSSTSKTLTAQAAPVGGAARASEFAESESAGLLKEILS